MEWGAFVDHIAQRLASGDTIEQVSSDLEGVRFCWTGVLHSKRLSLDDDLLKPSASVEMPTKWISTPDGLKVRCKMVTIKLAEREVLGWESCKSGDEVQFSFTLQADGPFQCIRFPKDSRGGRRLSLCAFHGIREGDVECLPTTNADRKVVEKAAPVRFKLLREHKVGPSELAPDVLTWSKRDLRCELANDIDLTPAMLREFWGKVLGAGMRRCTGEWRYLIADIRMDVGQISAQFFHADLRTLEPVSVLLSAPKLASTGLTGLSRDFGMPNACKGNAKGIEALLASFWRILFAPLSERWADAHLEQMVMARPRRRILGSLDCDLADLAEFVW